jgi:hypothetical protein
LWKKLKTAGAPGICPYRPAPAKKDGCPILQVAALLRVIIYGMHQYLDYLHFKWFYEPKGQLLGSTSIFAEALLSKV